VILKAENESLRNENYRLQTALRNVVCPNCGGPCVIGGEMGLDEQQVRLENARLREEVPMLLIIYYTLIQAIYNYTLIQAIYN
jgi:hypothetical protein